MTVFAVMCSYLIVIYIMIVCPVKCSRCARADSVAGWNIHSVIVSVQALMLRTANLI